MGTLVGRIPGASLVLTCVGLFPSQHDNQSWLAALTAILDASALAIVGVEGACRRQAQRTFAIARHAVVDLALVFGSPPVQSFRDRLPRQNWCSYDKCWPRAASR